MAKNEGDRGRARRGKPAPRRAQGGFGPYRKDDESSHRPRDQRRHRDKDDDAKPAGRQRLRVVRGGKDAKRPSKRARKPATQRRERAQSPRRRTRPGDVRDEILRLGGSGGPKYYDQLVRAADAFQRDHERDAIRILRPLRDALPDSPSVRELLGLSFYRDGKFTAAAKELEEYVRLSGAVDQHPVLMDCYRAQHRWKRVDDLWRELAATSPPPDLATEGRIVAAGALADRGRVKEALGLLGRREGKVTRPGEHHLRLWYALGDLEERAGNLPRARALFDRVRAHDPGFADVAERLAALA
jgi:tetratricopeptide (TPR) repeat protein